LLAQITEDLEESQMSLQGMLTMRHVGPFHDEAQSLLDKLSDTSETLEKWLKVQTMWTSLESVFTGGDISKQV
jgi:dynein heavy chain